MKIAFLTKAIAASFLISSWWVSSTVHATAASPGLWKAKQEAESKGFVFETSRDEIIAKAKKEGKVRVLSALDRETFKPMIESFKKKYPFIDVQIQEITGTEDTQRPLEWVGVEPVISRVHPIALSRSAPHPNAGKSYIDFVLSKEAQEMMVGGFFGISDRPDVKKPFSRPGLRLEFADLSLADQYDEITKRFDNIFLNRGR